MLTVQLNMIFFFYFFFNDTATTEIYTLSLHDALPIRRPSTICRHTGRTGGDRCRRRLDRKSTRLNSSHVAISYAVFCLTKKNKNIYTYYSAQTAEYTGQWHGQRISE